MTRPLVGIALIALVLAGCATRGSYKRLQAETGNLRVELTELRRSQDMTAKAVAQTLTDLRSLEARAVELQTGLRAATAELGRLTRRIGAAEDEIRQTRAMVTPPPAVAVATPPAAPERPAREPADDGAERTYEAALATFRSRELGQAVLDLLDFLATYPRHRLAPNAQYWIGEAYYVQRDYRQALVEFQKVLEFGPRASKAPDALLKIGLCYVNLRDSGRARQLWQRVVREYPTSEAAAKARSLLRARASSRG